MTAVLLYINTSYYDYDDIIMIPVLGVNPQDPAHLGQRSGEVQLVSRPGDMAVAEVLQVVIKTRSHGDPGAPSGDYLVVPGRAELTHIQTVF